MTRIHSIDTNSNRVMAALVSALDAAFGHGAGETLAPRFLAAEEADFVWETRISERWLGVWQGIDEDAVELDRIAILGRLAGRWVAAELIVDGNGRPHGLLGRRDFSQVSAARRAFAMLR